MTGEWIRVSKRQPCVICKHDHWCLLHKDRNAVIMEYGQAKNALIRIFHRMENNLCTYRQAKALERMGYTDTKNITFAEASAIISRKFGNDSAPSAKRSAPLCAPGYKKQDEVPF